MPVRMDMGAGVQQMHERASTDVRTAFEANGYGRPTDSEMGVW